MCNRTLSPYKIFHGLFISNKNELLLNKSVHGTSINDVIKSVKNVKGIKSGKFFIITDKQFGLMRNAPEGIELPKTKLSVHLKATNLGMNTLIPMTKKQFNNPIKN